MVGPYTFAPSLPPHPLNCHLSVSGEVYRGKLVEAEDNMNCQLSDVEVTMRDGRRKGLENAFVRGSKIRFFILPDMLKNAPMFKVGPAGCLLRSGPVK